MTARFNIFTGLLKAYEEPSGKKRFRTTASSTITDLAGDEIQAVAIEKMADKAKGNLTIFLNHEYRVPEDVLGSCVATSMQTRGADSEGNPIVDLDFDIDLNDSNPRAVQTWDAIKSGVKLGTSIGAIVRHAEKKKGGGLIIDDLELLEASIVGIPANPRSWVQYAMKSINAIDDIQKSLFLQDEDTVIKEADEMVVGEAGPETVEVLDKAACPTCGKGHDAKGCSDAYHKAAPEPETAEAEPDKEARTRVTVTVDNDSAQEAPKSTPGAALMDEDRADSPSEVDNDELGDDTTKSAEPEVAEVAAEPEAEADSSEMDYVASTMESLVKKLQTAVTENVDLRKQLADVESERNDLKENLEVAKGIIERIADLPLGRKTKFAGAVNDFRQKFPQYDNEFVKFLEKD